MNTHLLINTIVQQTMAFIAQLATAGGVRAAREDRRSDAGAHRPGEAVFQLIVERQPVSGAEVLPFGTEHGWEAAVLDRRLQRGV